jgi:hypothetical protein
MLGERRKFFAIILSFCLDKWCFFFTHAGENSRFRDIAVNTLQFLVVFTVAPFTGA